MTTVFVRYTIRADKVTENEQLIHAVYDELRATQPAGLRYETFKLEDGVSFMHLAVVDSADGGNPVLALDSFKRFVRDIAGRCTHEPVSTQLSCVDGYGPGSTAERGGVTI